jgi:glycosyltransferase involved in cell wall biosynthesis
MLMKNNRFIILVTQHNTVNYITKCLDSIITQDYDNYRVIVMDDASTDGTWEIIKNYPFNALHNIKKREYPVENFISGIELYATKPEDIIVFLSGDDWLACDDALSYLNKVYQDDIWFTYGQFIPASGNYGPYCKPIPDTRTYRRSSQWVTSHPLTCKKWLWDKIKDSDLRYSDGNYPNHSFDRAFVHPLVEMAGAKHIKFIEKILYIYNDQNPACVYKVAPEKSIAESYYYMNKELYKEL